ncbi:MAG TPA: hypothetical protein VN493_19305 [Thermoanaerobaculia bacterium]|nr:hypothetical protein [Thermoanaerobaculia bacterium]
MRTISRIVVVAGLLVLMTGAAAFAERSPHATLLYAQEVGPDGVRTANLQCAGATAGERSGVVLRNGGQHAATLFFSDGSELVLEPGHEVTLSEAAASTHKCACQCTCSSGTDFSQKLTFDCPAGGCAGENGSACVVFVGTELKEGTLSGCRKVYIPATAEPAEPAAEVE